jgi:phosphate-selective porin OprO/OprP
MFCGLQLRTGGAWRVAGFSLTLRLTLYVGLATLVAKPAFAQTEAETLAALRKLIDEQNRRIEALGEKIRVLEERENDRNAERLPTIVIDTNGAPVGLVAGGASSAASINVAPSNRANALPSNSGAFVSAGADGFFLKSADTNFVLGFHGLVQADSRVFFDDNPLARGNNGFVLRRARPIFEGSVFRDFDYQVVPDFGGSTVQLYDAYLNYKFAPEFQIRAGKFKGPVGLENLQSDTAALFNERSLASDLVPMRNVGIQAHGDVGRGVLGWTAGLYAADADSRLSGNTGYGDDFEGAGRLYLQPFKRFDTSLFQGLGFGAGASFSKTASNSAALPSTTGGSLPGYTTTGQRQFFAYNPVYGTVVADGEHTRLSPQGWYYLGPFGIQGEYNWSEQVVENNLTMRRARLAHSGWQVSAQWVLTGEKASFGALVPAHPFSLHERHWGAWQLVARYSELTLDGDAFKGFSDPTTSARGANAWTAGLNWWLNRNVRLLTSVSYTTFDGGGKVSVAYPSSLSAPATVSHQNECVFFTRLQIAF